MHEAQISSTGRSSGRGYELLDLPLRLAVPTCYERNTENTMPPAAALMGHGSAGRAPIATTLAEALRYRRTSARRQERG